jgi:pimeloyl-ACP methyl ester carboxylesterase
MTKRISSQDRTFFIIPGFKQKPNDKQFTWLEKFLKEKGFVAIKVPIAWDRRTMSDYVEDFIEVYKKHKSQMNYVLGFSYGAVIALLTANILKPNKIYLCSLSPDFKEDIHSMSPQIKKLVGRKRLAVARKNSGTQVAKV